MCAGYEVGGFGACPGDSGGPLMRYVTDTATPKYVQLGIVQGGVNVCGDKLFPDIYTRIEDPEVFNFIQRTAFKSTGSKCLLVSQQVAQVLSILEQYNYESTCFS